MARRVLRHGDRRSGWPPERSGHAGQGPLAADDVALAVLWALVLAGFLFVTVVILSTLFAWDGRLVSTALAAPESSASSDVEQPSLYAIQDGTSEGRPLTDVSSSVGVTLGRVVESSLHSYILDMDLPYRVYLPPGYDAGHTRYPVLYLLHGNGQAVYAEWTSDNRIGVIADALISSGAIQPMIIVMPDGEHSYWMNHYGDGERWEDYVVDEVIPYFDTNFRTIPLKEYRAIGGHSMGGSGALSIAFKYPELFAAVGGHSPSLRWNPGWAMPYFGPDSYYASYNPLYLASRLPSLDTLKIWVDYGEEDPWLEQGADMEWVLDANGIPNQWHMFPGAHYVTYWIEHGPDYLRFYSDSFGDSSRST